MNAKLKVGVVVALLSICAVVFQMQQMKMRQLAAENDDFRSRIGDLGLLQKSNQSLAAMIKDAVASAQTNQHELLRLRGQASRLRQLELENAQLKTRRQQSDQQNQKPLPSVVSEQEQPAVTETIQAASNSSLIKTDLGSLELEHGIPAYFDLGGGTNCMVTPASLADGNIMMEIQIGFTNADGIISKRTSRITAKPGQHCAISVDDRMIGLEVKMKP